MKKTLSLLLCMALLLGCAPLATIATGEAAGPEDDSLEIIHAEPLDDDAAPSDQRLDEFMAQSESTDASGALDAQAERALWETEGAPADEAWADQGGEAAVNATGVAINEYNFPDAAFRRYLREEVEGGSDDFLTAEEIAKIKVIDISNGYIDEENHPLQDLQGIAFLTALEQLNAGSYVKGLDVSNNHALVRLSCGSYYAPDFTTLNVSGCSKLEYLSCNNTYVEKLDLTHCPKLKTLFLRDMWKLGSVDLSGIADLESLTLDSYWDEGSHLPVRQLDLSHNPKLRELSVKSQSLTRLDLTRNPKLATVSCRNNYLNELILGEQASLVGLNCKANPLPNGLEIGGCPMMIECVKSPISSWGDPDAGEYYAHNLDYMLLVPAGITLYRDGVPMNPGSRELILAGKKLSIGVKESLQLVDKKKSDYAPASCAFESDKPKVVSVSAKGVVKGLKKGSATITVRTKDGAKELKVKVTVKAAPGSITLSAAKLTLDVGETQALKATLPKNTASTITFTSGKKKVATVDSNGVVTAVSPGKAVITATTFNKLKATCEVTVTDSSMSLTLSVPRKKVGVGNTLQITPVFEGCSKKKVTYASSDESVATVSAKGVVTGVKKGSVVITGTCENGLTAQRKLTVKVPQCRALLIGEAHYTDGNEDLPYTKNNVKRLKKALEALKGPGGATWKITARYDVQENDKDDGVIGTIVNAFKGADEDDISLLYWSGHGGTGKDNGKNITTLCAVNKTFRASDLIDAAFSRVKGRIVLIFDTCHSGGMIKQNGVNGNGTGAFDEEALAAFDAGIVDAVSRASHQDRPNNGEYCQDRFYVLTSCRYSEVSISNLKKDLGLFTSGLLSALHVADAKKGIIMADTNSDRKVTLNELYNYTYQYVLDCNSFSLIYPMHAQVYPKKCGMVLFQK